MQRRAGGQTEGEFAEMLHELAFPGKDWRYRDGSDRQGMGGLASSQFRVLLERVRYHHGPLPCS
ncbi:hypothetical protein A2U01_0102733, partial [Trifolium medium]|nr:hypothetical protein [Trifolium medium]